MALDLEDVWQERARNIRITLQATKDDLDGLNDAMIAEYRQLRKENSKLAAFKTYVHDYLTAKGIPENPGGPHSVEGCRIGDRLDLVFAEIASLKSTEAALYKTVCDVAAALGLKEWGNDELGPAVAALKQPRQKVQPAKSLVEAVDAAIREAFPKGFFVPDKFRESLLRHLAAVEQAKPQFRSVGAQAIEPAKLGETGWIDDRDCEKYSDVYSWALYNGFAPSTNVTEAVNKQLLRWVLGRIGNILPLAAVEPPDWRERAAKQLEEKINRSVCGTAYRGGFMDAISEIRKLPDPEGVRSEQQFVVLHKEQDGWKRGWVYPTSQQLAHEDDRCVHCTVTWLEPPPAAEPKFDTERSVGRLAEFVRTEDRQGAIHEGALMGLEIERLRKLLAEKERDDYGRGPG